MRKPSLKALNEIRKSGFRPGVVACVVHNKKLLMFYKRDHRLWQLPQGGIKNKENPIAALKRELTEELGTDFLKYLDFETVKIIETDKMEFKPGSHRVNELFDDEGNEVQMLGKEYFFCLIKSSSNALKIGDTQFDQYFWLSFMEAYFLTDKMYQKGKRRITLKILNKLNELGEIE